MLKKEISFRDLDDNLVTDTFYFNLSKAELAEMELTRRGGFVAFLERIKDTEDQGEIIKTFKEIILATYGVRDEDGRRFIKSQELTDAFMQTDAYSELFMELATNAEASAEFIRKVVPASLAEEAAKLDAATPRKPQDRKVKANGVQNG